MDNMASYISIDPEIRFGNRVSKGLVLLLRIFSCGLPPVCPTKKYWMIILFWKIVIFGLHYILLPIENLLLK